MPVREPWIDRVERRLARWCEQGLGKAWVVAVSGGGDSVGLLRVLHHLAGPLGLRLSVAHLDHGVRGEAARADAAFVAALAGSLDLPFVLGAWRPTRERPFRVRRPPRPLRLADRGRARSREASVIAVGHTRDDQAETILHRIIRGTGLRGLAGIPSRRVLSSCPRGHAGAPVASMCRATRSATIWRHSSSHSARMRPTPIYRGPAPGSGTTCCPSWRPSTTPTSPWPWCGWGRWRRRSSTALEADLRELEQSAVITRARRLRRAQARLLAVDSCFSAGGSVAPGAAQAGWPEASMSARRWRRLAALVRKRRDPQGRGRRPRRGLDRPTFLVLRRRPRRVSFCGDRDGRTDPLAVPGLTAVPWAGGTIDVRIDPGPEDDWRRDDRPGAVCPCPCSSAR